MPTFSMPIPPPPVPDKSGPQPTGQTPANYKDTFKSRASISKFADPCDKAREESMKCLDKNSYNKAKCNDFFQAYRDCKKQWLEQRREDRRNGEDSA